MNHKRRNVLAMLGPGMLVAATGVGAGDLATGALTGEKLGVAVLWAVVLGAALKYLLNEGLARWQLATGDTLLEGAINRLGLAVAWGFLLYLLVWSFLVGLALMSACGVTMHAILPLGEAAGDKMIYGVLHSVIAVLLVRWGGYALFEKMMGVCIAVMFAVVVVTAVALRPAWGEMLAGLVVPTIPHLDDEGLQWTIALMGGVGGTVTILCYGYWIREEHRTGAEDLFACRVDLAAAYLMVAVFGISMVTIGSRIEVEGGGSTLIVNLADRLQQTFGPAARWAFLVGAWGAVFSSLLGVWQSVPYLFADLYSLMTSFQDRSRQVQETGDENAADKRLDSRKTRSPIDTNARPYCWYLYGLAVVPMIGLYLIEFRTVQKTYAILGAAFMPMLAATLLALNGRSKSIGPQWRNSWIVNVILVATLLFFLAATVLEAVM